jgi:hypothetical protein
MAATTRTSPFFVGTYLNHDASPAAPTVEAVNMMTGVRASSYAGDAPPTGFPGAVRVSTGKVTFTFASSYVDAYGVSYPFTPQHCTLGMHGSSFLDATWTISGQAVTVSCFDAAGSALGDRRITLTVS